MDDKWQESWDRMEEKERRDIGEVPEPCEKCDGNGRLVIGGCLCPAPMRDEDCYRECSRCLGTGVQP
ncbi:hypothetical protein LCGC14_2633670 [marine sediment metagenome]|uniref:Uncharacterized protein n=1 Tax=marine sediment metagenome TaxID=412755 RepID=A0A0F9CAH5_9ZZZZ